MKTYEFTAILNGVEVMSDELAKSLYSVMDDASACSRDGVAMVQFDRESDSLERAIRSAIADVSKAGYTVNEIRHDADALKGLVDGDE